MRRRLALLLSAVAAAPRRAASWAHPGVLVSGAQLAFVAGELRLGREPFTSAFAKAAGSAFANASWALQGPPRSGVIECGGYSHP
jgi:hypothetical protein